MKKNKQRKSELIAPFALIIPIIGILLGTVVMLSRVSSDEENSFTGIGLISVLIGVILFIVFIFVDNNEINEMNKATKSRNNHIAPKLLKRVNKFKDENGFDLKSAIEIGEEYYWLYDDYFLSIQKDTWYKKNTESASGFYIDEDENDIKKPVDELPLLETRIKVEDIDYYLVKGEVKTEQIVSGGGSSLTGAVVGGVLAGGVGAIIGSRKKISTKSVTKDDREIILVYRIGKKVIKKPFDYHLYINMFESLLPEKEHTYVSTKKK